MSRQTQIPLNEDAIKILQDRKELIQKSNKGIRVTYSGAVIDLKNAADKAESV